MIFYNKSTDDQTTLVKECKIIKLVKFVISFMLLISFFSFTGCNITDNSRYRGEFYFYEKRELISGPVPVEKFILVKNVLKITIAEFGIIDEIKSDNQNRFAFMKRKSIRRGKYISLEGSDAVISIGMTNTKDHFRITLTDWSNDSETAFLIKLKQEIISNFKKRLGFSDLVFNEAGEFILNN